MAQSCSQCGSICRDDLKTCAFCDSPLTGEPFNQATELVREMAPRSPAVSRISSTDEPEWRQEMARKLDAYRNRRRGGVAVMAEQDSQPALPFIEVPRTRTARSEHRPLSNARAYTTELPAARPSQIPVAPHARAQIERMAQAPHGEQSARLAHTEHSERDDRVEISVSQPSLDFTPAEHRLHPENRLAPVSATAERIQAGLIDIFFLAVVYAGFLFFFRSLGGHMDLTKTDAGIFAASFLLLYASYFSLFMIFGAATPGMLLSGLTVVQIDGATPETGALAWRSAGYVLSGGTIWLGFLWAIWDEDHLTWHDRISQTYITDVSAHAATNPFADAFLDDEQDLFHPSGNRQSYAEK